MRNRATPTPRRKILISIQATTPRCLSEYQSAVYKLVLARGGRETYDQILELREARPLNEEKKSCLVESCVEINQ